MNKLLTILSFLTISSTCLAQECLTKEAKAQRQRIENSNEIDLVTKKYLLEQETQVEVTEILACSSKNQSISRAEAELAVSELQKSERSKIQDLYRISMFLTTELQDPSLNESLRKSYEAELAGIPNEIRQISVRNQKMINKINSNVR